MGLSKLRALDHPEERLLSLPEALYLATKGPGEFFGKVGSFEPGYDFDALVVDVDELDGRLSRTPFEKLEQFLYCLLYLSLIHILPQPGPAVNRNLRQ